MFASAGQNFFILPLLKQEIPENAVKESLKDQNNNIRSHIENGRYGAALNMQYRRNNLFGSRNAMARDDDSDESSEDVHG